MNYKNILLDSGYSKIDVFKYFYVDSELISDIVKRIYDKEIKLKKRSYNSQLLIIGGQPGSGKSYYCSELLVNNDNFVYVSLDNFRKYHPYKKEIRDLIISKWGNYNGDEVNNPSTDLTMFTHYFAVKVNNELLDLLFRHHYNVLLEWNLRDYNGVNKYLKKVYALEYICDIVVIIVDRYTSYNACLSRYRYMMKDDRLARRVNLKFHDTCVTNLSLSIRKILDESSKFINSLYCINRDGSLICDKNDYNVDIIVKLLNTKNSKYINDCKYINDIYNNENIV